MSKYSDGFDTGRIFKQCEECKRKAMNLYLFEERWVCFECVKMLSKKRNKDYYDQLYRIRRGNNEGEK